MIHAEWKQTSSATELHSVRARRVASGNSQWACSARWRRPEGSEGRGDCSRQEQVDSKAAGTCDESSKDKKTDYDATHKDNSEPIDALERANAVLEKQAYDRKQAAALLQVSALTKVSLIPLEAKMPSRHPCESRIKASP